MYHYILFDLDGTLTDPKEGICKSVQHALSRAGIEAPDIDALTPFIGPPLSHSFREFYGMDDAAAEKAVADYRERFSEVGWKENIPYPGIDVLLKHCKEKGARLAVASSKPQVFVERILEYFKLKKYFDVVIGSGLDGSLGTKEEVVREALRKLYLLDHKKMPEIEKRALTVMVGDRKYDVDGAHSEEIDAIGVSYGYQQPGELAEAGADAIAGNVEELEELLLSGDKKAAASENGKTVRKKRQAVPKPIPESSFLRAVYMLFPLVLYYAIRIAAAYAFRLWIQYVSGGSEQKREELVMDTTWPVAVVLVATIIGLWLIFCRTEPVRDNRGAGTAERLRILSSAMFLGMLLALGLNSVLGFAAAQFGDKIREALEVPLPETSGYLAGVVLYGLLSPLAEELLFRWVLLNRLERVFPLKMAVVLSALFFGIYHGNLLQGVYAFLMGLVLAYLCVSTNSLFAAFVFHASANILIYTTAFLPAEVVRTASSLPFGLLSLTAGIVLLIVYVKTGKGKHYENA